MKKKILLLFTAVIMSFSVGLGASCAADDNSNKPSPYIDMQRISDYQMQKTDDEFELTVKSDKDFVILNLTDIQLEIHAWILQGTGYEQAKKVMAYLIDKVQPDLITFTGDMCYGQPEAYKKAAELFDYFGRYWAPVLGNHDHNQNAENQIAKIYSSSKYCLFDAGDPELGTGNYLIKLVDSEKNLREVLFFMDTHDRADGGWAHLNPNQLDWYKAKVEKYSTDQQKVDSTVFIHIPVFGYNYALQNAINCDALYTSSKFDSFCNKMPLHNKGNTAYWKEGYTDSFGVRWESTCTPERDEGAFDLFKQLGSTHNVVCGHDHKINFSICYQGIRLTYGTKSSYGSYYDERLLGGTVVTVNQNGVNDVYHVYYEE